MSVPYRSLPGLERVPTRVQTKRREEGAIAVMFAATVLVIVGFFSLALDLSMVYNRKMEMQNIADALALAAASELNGTKDGVSSALARASERLVLPSGTASGTVLTYQYSTRTMSWSDAAISFASSPDGPWQSAGAAAASPGGLLFARADTRGLDAEYGKVRTLFIQVLSRVLDVVATTAHAVAGRTAISVSPLGLCAMRPEAARSHNGELEEYGFRRGVAYDLMQLNPDSTADGRTFLINPFVPPGSAGGGPAPSVARVAPFVCTGTLAVSRVTGGKIRVSTPFPLSDLYGYFNSRFDSYTPPCNAETAPPDQNIKEYKFNNGSVPWMTVAPAGQSAALSTVDGKRWTVVGPDETPAGTTAEKFAPLWSFARAAQFASYSPGVPEPPSGYATFTTSDWNTLYSPGKPKATASYPATTPYAPTSGANFRAPSRKGIRERRVLNIPLLACPVVGNQAMVVGIGRFFMTVQASSAALYGEFAGLASEQTLGAQVRLYP